MLSDPIRREEYDKELQNGSLAKRDDLYQKSYPGLETVDLDELNVGEGQNEWYRSCRCGLEKGFVINENDLENNADQGEVIAGCQGCSLWIKVLFTPVADDGETSAI